MPRLPFFRPKLPIPPPAAWGTPAGRQHNLLAPAWSTSQPWRHPWVKANSGVLWSFVLRHAHRSDWVWLRQQLVRPFLLTQGVLLALLVSTSDQFGPWLTLGLAVGVNLGLLPLWQPDRVFWNFVAEIDADSLQSKFIEHSFAWFAQRERAYLARNMPSPAPASTPATRRTRL
jgi:hypothetical protein